MEETTCRAYIPDTKPIGLGKNSFEYKTFQSLSRDKHNKERAANHRLNQKKIETIKTYENKPIFAFTLLEESISVSNKKIRSVLNNQIRKYENKIRAISNSNNDDELSKVCDSLEKIAKDIEKIVNKNNFLNLAKKGYFKTKSNKDILKDEDYKDFIGNLTVKKDIMKTPPIFKDSFINRNVSFADKLKQNL